MAMQSPADKLLDATYELAAITQRLLHHYEKQEYHLMATVDVSGILAVTTQLNTLAEGLSGTTAAEQLTADQAAVTDAASGLATAANGLAAKLNPTPPALTVAPVAFSVTGGEQSVPLSVTGGTGPYTVSGLPAGITSDGVNVTDDGSTTSGTTTATVTDSTTPTALQGPLVVTVA